MNITDAIQRRIDELLVQAKDLTRGNEHGQVHSEPHRYQCAAWIAASANIVTTLCPDFLNSYRLHFSRVVAQGANLCAHEQVGELSAVLEALAKDAKSGLLSSLTDHVRAETFGSFLDHAVAYANDQMKQEAGVIAGVVLEDTIRRICKKRQLPEAGIKLDQLITDLVKAGALSDLKAKRARAAAHVRTKATHAQWDDFDLNDVTSCIAFIREIITSELGA